MRLVRGPPKHALVYREHYSGVRHDAHQVSAKTTIECPCTFLRDDKFQSLDDPFVLDDPIHQRLAKSRSENLCHGASASGHR